MPLKRPLLSLSTFYFLLSAFTLLTPAQTIDPILARRRTLDNVSITFNKTLEHSPDMEMIRKLSGGAGAKNTFHRIFTFQNQFAYLHGRVRYKESPISEPHDWFNPFYHHRFYSHLSQEYVITPDRALALTRRTDPHFNAGIIYTKMPPTWTDSVIEVALGLRPYQSDDFLSPEDLSSLPISRENNQLILTQIDKREKVHRWYYGLTPETPLLSYTVNYKDKDKKENLSLQITNKDFTTIAGISIPKTIVAQFISRNPDGKIFIVKTETLHLTKILINDPTNTPESIDITWPVGAGILDKRTGRQLFIRGNDKTLSDTDIANLPTPAPRLQRTAPPPPN